MFKRNTVGAYHDLCLESDFLLLVDVSQKFINTCLEYYGLDPCHYFNSREWSLDAMFKMTGIELELIPDIQLYLFIENGMRQVIYYIAKICSKANNTPNHMIVKGQICKTFICIKIVYIIGEWFNICLIVDLNS